MKPSLRLLSGVALCIAFAGPAPAAVIVEPYYASTYSVLDLGPVAGVPANYGGLTLKQDDNSTLLLGGAADSPNAKIYSVHVQRDPTGHITGFGGTAAFFANANGTMGGIDGGLAYAPNGVLLYTVFPDNQVGQIKPGGTDWAKLVTLTGMHRTFIGGLLLCPLACPERAGSRSRGWWGTAGRTPS